MNGYASKNGLKNEMNGVFSKSSLEKHEKPLSNTYVSLGEGKGVKVVVWPRSVTLERTEKKDGQWQATEEFHLAHNVVKELAWRATHWLQEMDKAREIERKKQ